MLRDWFNEDSENGNEDLENTTQITKQIKQIINCSDSSNSILMNPITLRPQKIRSNTQIRFDGRLFINFEKWIMKRRPLKSYPLIKGFDVMLQQMVVVVVMLGAVKEMVAEVFQVKFYWIAHFLFEAGAFFYCENWNLQVVDEVIDVWLFCTCYTFSVRILRAFQNVEPDLLSLLSFLTFESSFNLSFPKTIKAKWYFAYLFKLLKLFLNLIIILKVVRDTLPWLERFILWNVRHTIVR